LKLFKVKFASQGLIEAERFTVDELSAIWGACMTDRHRLWILLGLNCGLDRTGLATLDWSMVKGLAGDKPYNERMRHKTGVYSRHALWLETADMLRQLPLRERKGLVCLTERGKPLLELTPGGCRDATQQAWRYIIERAGVRKLSFGKLRKTGSWLAKVVGGLDVSEMYLAHNEVGMNKHYAGRDWGKLDGALDTMRSQLMPLLSARVEA